MRPQNHTQMGTLAVSLSLTTLQLGNGLAVGLIDATGPGLATALRVGISAVALLPALLFSRYSTPPSLRQLLIYGVTLGLMQLSFYQAISLITLSMAVCIEFLVPLIIGSVSSRSRRVRLPVAGAMIGLALVADYTGEAPLAGILWASITGILLSIYIKVGTELPRQTHPLVMLSKALWIAFPIAAGGFALMPGKNLLPLESLVVQAFLVAVMTMIIPFALELLAMKRLRPLSFALVSAMDPVLASAVGAIGLGQHLELRQYTGVVVLTACAVLAIRADTKLRTTRTLQVEQCRGKNA